MHIVIYKFNLLQHVLTWAGCHGIGGLIAGLGTGHTPCKLISNTVYLHMIITLNLW